MKKTPGDIIIYNSVPKIMIICYTFPEIWHITDVLIFHFGPFCALLPLQQLEKSKFKKMKKVPEDIIILRKCTKNHDHMLYCSGDMACVRCNSYFSFWVIFFPFTPLTAWKIKIKKNEKNPWRYYHFTYVYQKLWWDDVQFLRYGAQWMDRWTDGQKKGHIEVGAPPKKIMCND